MDLFLKSIHIIVVTVLFAVLGYGLIRSFVIMNIEKKILRDPCYTEATILDITPGTPSEVGVLSINVHYRFTAEDGSSFEKDDELATIKTMDLPKYQTGGTIPVVYLKAEPSKNMLNIRNAMKDIRR